MSTDSKRVCPECGCSDDDACQVWGVPCCWVNLPSGELVCSACAPPETLAASPAGRVWFRNVSRAAIYARQQHPPFSPCQHGTGAHAFARFREVPHVAGD
mgnify:FL=1